MYDKDFCPRFSIHGRELDDYHYYEQVIDHDSMPNVVLNNCMHVLPSLITKGHHLWVKDEFLLRHQCMAHVELEMDKPKYTQDIPP